MRHAFRGTLITVGIAGVVALLVFAFLKSSEAESARRTIAEQKETNAAIVEGVYRLSRERHAQDSAKIEQANRALALTRARSVAVLASSGRTIDSLRSAFGDTERGTVSGDGQGDSVPRSAFTNAVFAYDSLANAFHEYLWADSVAHEDYDAERAGLYKLLTLADQTIAEKNLAIEGWRNVSECRIVFGIRCPTRTQVAVLGSLAGLYVGWRLTRKQEGYARPPRYGPVVQ